ncbi:DUF697 domain-containing protein [Neolewinella aurantiaca]|uniref:DUF697 domain-containing protein n=1 Tax=Neolewinella aurantiaca TaxID=2602767 RepID=A0A5C7F2C8_9BACT|nr:DUF697 domain-containing protein [Neolewinella aurantiaca]TXF84246.1 DUF697 domain-containing protein [Neolewinella aurantiaca]
MAPSAAKKAIQDGTPFSTAVAKDAVTVDLENKSTEANNIIRRYALFSTASGLIPFIGLDVLAATAIQTKMVKDLADIYGYDIDDQLLRTIINTGITSVGGRILTQIAGSLAETVTPLKMFVNGATQAAVSGFLTLEIGNIYKSKMELGENPADISVMEIANHMVSQIQEGKWDPNKLSLTNQLGGMFSANKQ